MDGGLDPREMVNEDIKEEEDDHMISCPDDEERPFAEFHVKSETDVTESPRSTYNELLQTIVTDEEEEEEEDEKEEEEEEEEEEEDYHLLESLAASNGYEDDWHQAGWQPNSFPFTATPGPREAAAELDSDRPVDFLELFLTDELLQNIADHTNLYASQYFEARPYNLPYSRCNAWIPVSVPELKTFFGLSFLTGYIKKPSLELYWSVDEIDATPHFSQTMPRNRFQIISRFLHYNISDALQDPTDKIDKVRPVLDYIVEKFKEMYQPGQNICIDDGMMQRLSSRVFDTQKPVKHGIKSYILCDSATGYCFNVYPCVGEASTLPDVVFALLDRLPGQGYTLFMDNFYNSVTLCELLLGAQTNVCGTLRKNRGEPPIVSEMTSKADLGVGEKVVRHNGRVMVVAWRDRQLVKMATTCHQDKMQRLDVWQRGCKYKVAQFKPECIVAYNSSMNGVDKLDQILAYYPFIQRSLNWPNAFVAHLFQLCVFNAHVLYRARNPGGCKTLLEFIRKVVKSWTVKRQFGGRDEEEGEGEGEAAPVEEEEGRRPPRAPYNTDPESRLDGLLSKHKLEHLMPTGRKGRPARRCRVCARKGLRRETKMWCKSCSVPLHPGECFNAYHTKLNYSM